MDIINRLKPLNNFLRFNVYEKNKLFCWYVIVALIVLFSSIVFGGVSDIVKTDFDGTPRPQGIAYDIGAYEYVEESPVMILPGIPTLRVED